MATVSPSFRTAQEHPIFHLIARVLTVLSVVLLSNPVNAKNYSLERESRKSTFMATGVDECNVKLVT